METTIQTGTMTTPAFPKKKVPVRKKPEVKITKLERGSTGPVKVGTLLGPIRQIINHPDRNRLIAEYFKDYK